MADVNITLTDEKSNFKFGCSKKDLFVNMMRRNIGGVPLDEEQKELCLQLYADILAGRTDLKY